MVETKSQMLPLGTEAPDFRLPDPDGVEHSLEQFTESPALLIIFMCNHCPYVKHVREQLVELVKEYQERGVSVVAINSNDVEEYPQDSPEMMKEVAETYGFTFPYLYDESQEVAKAYRAACTPDFYVFDDEQKLFYRGQMDNSRPGSDIPVTGDDLRDALDAVLAGDPPPEQQKPSMGCNIKWKPGNAPPYFG